MYNQNAKYTSKTSLNELIFERGEYIKYIKERIIYDIKKAKYFSVLADETTDVLKLSNCFKCLKLILNTIIILYI